MASTIILARSHLPPHSRLSANTHTYTYTRPQMDEQFARGRLHAVISSRPGQTGRVDGYILEGKELEFYLRPLAKKKAGK